MVSKAELRSSETKMVDFPTIDRLPDVFKNEQ